MKCYQLPGEKYLDLPERHAAHLNERALTSGRSDRTFSILFLIHLHISYLYKCM